MEELENYRKEIDQIDGEIIKLLHERMQVILKIKEVKKANSLMFFDKKRYIEMIEARMKEGKKLNLKEEFVKEIFNAIHEESLNLQLSED